MFSIGLCLPARRLFAPQVVAPLGLGLTVIGFGATTGHAQAVATVAVLSFTALALLGRALETVVLPWTALAGAILAFGSEAMLAATAASEHPTMRELWLEGHGVGMLAVAALSLLPWLVVQRTRRPAAAGLRGLDVRADVRRGLPRLRRGCHRDHPRRGGGIGGLGGRGRCGAAAVVRRPAGAPRRLAAGARPRACVPRRPGRREPVHGRRPVRRRLAGPAGPGAAPRQPGAAAGGGRGGRPGRSGDGAASAPHPVRRARRRPAHRAADRGAVPAAAGGLPRPARAVRPGAGVPQRRAHPPGAGRDHAARCLRHAAPLRPGRVARRAGAAGGHRRLPVDGRPPARRALRPLLTGHPLVAGPARTGCAPARGGAGRGGGGPPRRSQRHSPRGRPRRSRWPCT